MSHTLLLKIFWLDKEDTNNYRPIFNLPFISKLIEKVLVRRIEGHLENNIPNESYQSSYHIGHSTKTVLFDVHSDITEVLDEGFMTTLC